MQRIAIIDYGMGNLQSVSKALEQVAPDDEVLVTNEASVIASADRIVCPGQGAAADCMSALIASGLGQSVIDTVHTRPFLGICMGFQVLLSRSEENRGVDCLNVIPGHVARFEDPLSDADGIRLKVPHMGWSQVEQAKTHPMWNRISDHTRFYFAHSLYCIPDDQSVITGTTRYGQDIAVSVAFGKLFACQFHPEKSSTDGLQFLENFTRWQGDS